MDKNVNKMFIKITYSFKSPKFADISQVNKKGKKLRFEFNSDIR